MGVRKLLMAKERKDDEFYTKYETVENELIHHLESLKDKKVYCNCDDWEKSNFWKYLYENFRRIGLKSLTATAYNEGGQGKIATTKDGQTIQSGELESDGSFLSDECKGILQNNDIIITNPPFSLAFNFIDLMLSEGKEFLIIGSQTLFTSRIIFNSIRSGRLSLGYTIRKGGAIFLRPDGSGQEFGSTIWFTTLPTIEPTPLELTKKYTPEDYPTYDNCPAISVDKTKDIPSDYYGLIGVPITFFIKWNKKQFEVLDLLGPKLNGQHKFQRLIIRRLKQNENLY